MDLNQGRGFRLHYGALPVGEGAEVLGCVVAERFGEISWLDGEVCLQ